jgi:hypothetical protein
LPIHETWIQLSNIQADRRDEAFESALDLVQAEAICTSIGAERYIKCADTEALQPARSDIENGSQIRFDAALPVLQRCLDDFSE